MTFGELELKAAWTPQDDSNAAAAIPIECNNMICSLMKVKERFWSELNWGELTNCLAYLYYLTIWLQTKIPHTNQVLHLSCLHYEYLLL